ncbi:hypothetical protein ACJJIQ_24695 [Microbulbifer sp. ANSA003]|uniref:hypothetical protein n=1 Tax=Microbulbifer sp. ANSA003 TaxID=3243360 RepID=UPI002B2F5B59|nr:hypothetical protein QT397_06420 [Microbulbifer sp. MKSA007]
MKERPISFNGDMVRAIRDNRKTQTRRLIKPQPFSGATNGEIIDQIGGLLPGRSLSSMITDAWQCGFVDVACRYGEIGDRLRVQEEPSIVREITDIRIERIQDISEEDAKAEGCYSNEEYADLAGKENIWPCRVCEGYQAHSAMGIHFGWEEVDCVICDTPIKRFRELWRSVYGEDNWNQNPWVWVIEFRRVEQQAEAAA